MNRSFCTHNGDLNFPMGTAWANHKRREPGIVWIDLNDVSGSTQLHDANKCRAMDDDGGL